MNVEIMPIHLGMVKAFLLKGDKNILVDTGMTRSHSKITAFFKKNHIDPHSISLIILTHNHTDHSGSVAHLKELTGAKLMMHKKEAVYLESGKSTPVQTRNLLFKIMMKVMKTPSLEPVPVDLLVTREYDLEPFGVDAKVLHTPGHTIGSLSVLLKNGDAIVGDIITGKKRGKGSVSKFPFVWNDKVILVNSLHSLMKKGVRNFYNAHGDVCDYKAVLRMIEKAGKTEKAK